MKKITTLMCAVALWCSAQAQAPALHFGRDGKFRIAQFTDVHLDLGTPYRRAQAEKTIAQMRYILDAEHPDLVVFTGDVVTGKPAAEAWHRVLEPVAERNLPFCVVLGNHDAEQDLTRAHLSRIVYLNPDYLARLFKKELGVSLGQYIKDRRMEKACHALVETRMAVSRIAGMVGYDNYSYFIKLFREQFGMTPVEYRKAHATRP